MGTSVLTGKGPVRRPLLAMISKVVQSLLCARTDLQKRPLELKSMPGLVPTPGESTRFIVYRGEAGQAEAAVPGLTSQHRGSRGKGLLDGGPPNHAAEPRLQLLIPTQKPEGLNMFSCHLSSHLNVALASKYPILFV